VGLVSERFTVSLLSPVALSSRMGIEKVFEAESPSAHESVEDFAV
jgi:hypothetical protein